MNKLVTALIPLLAWSLPALAPPAALAADQADPALLQRLEQAGGLERHPDANAVIVESSTRIEFKADGSYLQRGYELVRVLTDAGKQEHAEVGFDYTRQYDALRVERARVIKPDGTVIEVPQEMIKDVTHPALAMMNIYDANARMISVTFKNLEVGDALELAVVDSCYQAPMDGQYDRIELFQGTDPIISQRLEIIGPAAKPLTHVIKDNSIGIEFSSERLGDRVRYLWQAREVPRIIPEPAMPELLALAPRVLVSTIGSWEEISRWWAEMTDRFRQPDDQLRQITHELTKDLKTDDEKIAAVYHFVAQKIRYMGLGTGRKAGFEPKPVTETLSTRYGVCRDVAVLMCSMLDVLGIESHPVLTRAGETVDPEVPVLGFNHAIVALPDGNGGWRYSDPTVENCPDLLLPIEAEASMLVCTAPGQQLAQAPRVPAEDNLGSIRAKSRIDAQGRLVSEVEIATKGIYDVAFRGWGKSRPPQQLQVFWQRVLTGLHPGARLTGFSMSDPEDLATPFGLRFSYEIDEYAIQAGDYLLVKAPVSTGGFELILENFLGAAGLPERQYPFRPGVTLGALQEEQLVLPEGYTVKSLPETISLGAGELSYRMDYRAAASSEDHPAPEVSYSKKFLIDSKELSPARYLELKKILRESSRSGRGEVILVRDGALGGPR